MESTDMEKLTPVKSKTTTKKPDKTRRKNPIPNAKQFTSDYQPDPKNVSKGIQERNARLVIQRELEATLEEMLKDPMTDTLKLTSFIKTMPKHKTIVQAVTGLLMRDMLNPNTDGKDRMKLLETLIKSGYGDKMTVDTKVEVGPTLAEAIAMAESRLNIDNKDL